MSVSGSISMAYACDRCRKRDAGVVGHVAVIGGDICLPVGVEAPPLPDGWVHIRIGGAKEHHFCSRECHAAAIAEANAHAAEAASRLGECAPSDAS